MMQCGLFVTARAYRANVTRPIFTHFIREGAKIGYQIVRALLNAQVRVFFVTHRFSFAERFQRQHALPTLFLRAERQSGGHQNFKPPLLPTTTSRPFCPRTACPPRSRSSAP